MIFPPRLWNRSMKIKLPPFGTQIMWPYKPDSFSRRDYKCLFSMTSSCLHYTEQKRKPLLPVFGVSKARHLNTCICLVLPLLHTCLKRRSRLAFLFCLSFFLTELWVLPAVVSPTGTQQLLFSRVITEAMLCKILRERQIWVCGHANLEFFQLHQAYFRFRV